MRFVSYLVAMVYTETIPSFIVFVHISLFPESDGSSISNKVDA